MSEAGAPRILRSDEAGVARLVLNRPEKRNALDDRLLAELKNALRDCDADPDVRVVSLSGAGPDFCAGIDLAALQRVTEATVLENLEDVDRLAELFLLIRGLRKPVVAVVQGRALAGGCGLATACDLVLAARSATFAYTEVRIGFVPAMVTAILRRNVTEKRAFELIARGDSIGAEEAERIGLVNQVFEDEELEGAARAYTGELAARSASAVQLCKRLLYHQDGMSFEAALRAGADLNVVARMSEDTKAGVARFLDRRRE
jgi:methylglutaconyl-CoA hydratase